ncbi:hypothetical protein ACUXST_001999 [Sphingomonas sp. F9_3S_D5_B_2]
MTRRIASCRCGRFRATVTGEPVRVSVCHCLECKKRSGSAFAAQARWPADQVSLEGESGNWSYVGDSGRRVEFHFCTDCGAGVYYESVDPADGQIAIPLGIFDDPYMLQPSFSVWEERKNDWVEIVGEGVEHSH